MPKINQAELKELVDYNPETGVFTLKQKIKSGTRWPGQSLALERDGRMILSLKQRTYTASHLAFLFMAGYIPQFVTYLNGNPRDIRWKNLAARETMPKPATTGKIFDRDAYTPRKVSCDHCSYSWVANFDLAVSWLKCAHCQRVLRGDKLRSRVTAITTVGDWK